MIYTGTADKNLMLAYFQNILPMLPINSMVVMDNASWHKSKELQELFDRYNVELKFQAPYTPETNPIERIWGLAKRELRSYFDYSMNLFDNLCFVISNLTGELKSVNCG
jgi:transposase